MTEYNKAAAWIGIQRAIKMHREPLHNQLHSIVQAAR